MTTELLFMSWFPSHHRILLVISRAPLPCGVVALRRVSHRTSQEGGSLVLLGHSDTKIDSYCGLYYTLEKW